MKPMVKGFIESHPITMACLQMSPILLFKFEMDPNLFVKMAQFSKFRHAIGSFIMVSIILINLNNSHRILQAYKSGEYQENTKKTALSVLLYTLFNTLTFATVLTFDRCALINGMVTRLHQVKSLCKLLQFRFINLTSDS